MQDRGRTVDSRAAEKQREISARVKRQEAPKSVGLGVGTMKLTTSGLSVFKEKVAY